MKLLIVDDSKAMRAIVRRHVQAVGIRELEIEEAADGAEALELIRRQRPDLVLSDWNMPTMTGIELLEALRAEGIDVPFGFVTSESQDTFQERAFDAGAQFVIAKPFTDDDFTRALARFT